MCELFAMSARLPATVRLSLSELARHGGETGPHADGWGVAFQEETDVRLLREPDAASSSVCAEVLQQHAIKSPMVLAHIRLATQGPPALKNTQPFVRELAGRTHTFAHNGRLDTIEDSIAPGGTRFRRVGDTDSEYAFCVLLHRLEELWTSGATPALQERYVVVSAFAREITRLGPANFMYADGDALFVHADQRKQQSGHFEPPGLHLLYRNCDYGHRPFDTKAVKVHDGQNEQAVALIASVPLSEEPWLPLAQGTVLAFRAGGLVAGNVAANP